MAAPRDTQFTLIVPLDASAVADFKPERGLKVAIVGEKGKVISSEKVKLDDKGRADVRFSFDLLKERGRPNHRSYYRKVKSVDLLDERTIRFDLAGANDRELPLILGLMPILPRHATDPATFEETTLEPPVGSGPYVIGEVRAGESLMLKRDPNWWGRDLPINRCHATHSAGIAPRSLQDAVEPGVVDERSRRSLCKRSAVHAHAHALRKRLIRNAPMATIRKTKNRILAMPAAPAAIPPNPRTAAISAITKKTTA